MLKEINLIPKHLLKPFIKTLKLFMFYFFISNSMLHSSDELNIIFSSKMPDITDEKIGSYSQLASLLQTTKANNPNVLFLFGGGSLGPSAMSTLDRGSHIIDILNNLEPDAMAVNNREFSFYEDELSLRSFEASFPIVGSNILNKVTNQNIDGIEKYAILHKGNIKIGFITVLNQSVIHEYNIKKTLVHDISHSVTKISNELKSKGVDIIILHSSEFGQEINQLIENNIIDLAFTKDLDFNPNNTDTINNRYILISDVDGVANLKIVIKEKKIISFKNNIVSLRKESKEPNIERTENRYKNKLNLLLQEKIGTFTNKVDTTRTNLRTKENGFGNFIADVFRNYTGADIAICNTGAIRGNTIYNEGHSITRKDIYKELPYRDNLILLEVTGQQVIDAIEHGLYFIKELKGRFLQVSGIQVQYDKTEKQGHRVKEIFINGSLIDKEKLYKLVTTHFIATGGDDYHLLENSKSHVYKNMSNRIISDIVIEYIKKQKLIATKIEDRLNEINTIR